jgi:hypothetical protein
MFFPDEAVRVAALSEYVDRSSERRSSTAIAGGNLDRNHGPSDRPRTQLLGRPAVVIGSSGIGFQTT